MTEKEIYLKILDAEINHAISLACVYDLRKDKTKGDMYMKIYDTLVRIKKIAEDGEGK